MTLYFAYIYLYIYLYIYRSLYFKIITRVFDFGVASFSVGVKFSAAPVSGSWDLRSLGVKK